MGKFQALRRWFTLGLGVKRWLLLLLIGISFTAGGVSLGILKALAVNHITMNVAARDWLQIFLAIMAGLLMVGLSLIKLSYNLLAPYRRHQHGRVVDVVYSHSKRNKGLKLVAIGGGTGLPAVLRGMKAHTSNITAVVTVADDGGSSGRLREELGVLPPGDLRNNIAALADDENLMTQLFQYRFRSGNLDGHAFGNLFITALAGVSGSLESALIETARVLNIQGRVLPATLQEMTLEASVVLPDAKRAIVVRGESKITAAGGRIEHLSVSPPDVEAYSESVQAILDADLVVIGPGSLYTSILPNLVIPGIAEALRATTAYKIYICNVATQPGETVGYSTAEHILALEDHIGRGMFQAVIANNNHPTLNAGITQYVQLAPSGHEVLKRYDVRYTDLVDEDRPWRHDPQKLAGAILMLNEETRAGKPVLV